MIAAYNNFCDIFLNFQGNYSFKFHVNHLLAGSEFVLNVPILARLQQAITFVISL